MSNIKPLLDKLNEISSSETIDVYIHRTGDTVKFSPMTAKHEKDLIRIFSTPLSTFKEITPYIHGLVYELCEDKSINFSSVEIPNILLYIRRQTAGDIYKDEETKSEINISDLIEKNKTLDFKQEDLSKIIEVPFGEYTFRVFLDIPSGIHYERPFYDYIKNCKVETVDEIVTQSFSVEMVKIIKKIEIDKEDRISISMDAIDNVKQKIQILEQLPAKITQEIRDHIKDMKRFERDCLTLDGKTVKLNQNLFISK